MRGRHIAYRAISIAFTAMACTSVAEGQISALHIVSRPTPADVLPGYVVNDVLIDFNGRYLGSQMTVELTSGSIFQSSSPFAGTTPPIAAIFLEDPTVEWDSFLANGGTTRETTVGQFGVGEGRGCAHCFPVEGTFTEEAIDQVWYPTAGNVVEDQMGFLVARVTLSVDATGTFEYIGSAGGVLGVAGFPPDGVVSLPVRNGFIIPEPATVGLLAVGLAVAMAARRCARSTRPFAF